MKTYIEKRYTKWVLNTKQMIKNAGKNWEAEDIVHHAVLRILEHKKTNKLMLNMNEEERDKYMTTILYISVVSETSDYQRNNIVPEVTHLNLSSDIYPIWVVDNEKEMFAKEEHFKKEAILNNLDEKIKNLPWYKRKVLQLYFADNKMTFRKLSQQTNIPITALYTSYCEAINEIKGEKKCSKCGKKKEIKRNFYVVKNKGYMAMCKDCFKNNQKTKKQ